MSQNPPPTPTHRRVGRPATNPAAEAGSTRTVDRALSLLDAVLAADGASTLSGLARSVALSPSTASRLLDTLARHGLVGREEDGTYRTGIRLKQVAAAALRDDPLYDLSQSHLEALAALTREVASLGIPLGPDEVLYLRQVMAPGQLVQAIGWVGRTIPRRGTALGMAMDGLVGAGGYAVSSRDENEVDAVAVPVRDHRGVVVGALSVSAPRYRTSLADLERFGEALAGHGTQLSASLGAPEDVTTRVTSGTPGR
ncbi:MAG: helix-turn-helix domain-containing protein [Propionicimonas sp.]|uniref:IclR family transcriptional regulator n=1 Tax=Propionicimonas sp. TaxID=1955623 RepID=UPI003D0D9EC5